jgi:hypothetical protein
VPFWPILSLSPYFQGKNIDFAYHGSILLCAAFLESAHDTFTDGSVHPGFFVRLVAPSEVVAVGERFSAVPFDIQNVFWSHRGDLSLSTS